jgi:hypothetical protein
MKITAAIAAAGLTAILLASCSSNGGASGGTCSAPLSLSGCGSCESQTGCEACASTFDAAGVDAYNQVLECVSCTACYTTCQGSAPNSGCTGAPPTTDACDTGTPGASACSTCQTCASTGTCQSEITACKAIPACVDLVTNLYMTCDPLPL